MKNIFAILIFLIGVNAAQAQRISPILVQYYHGKGSGSIVAENVSLQPMTVIVEPTSVSPSAPGSTKPDVEALDPSVKVDLDSRSAVIGIGQKHIFNYKISSPNDTIVALWVTFIPPKPKNNQGGMQPQMHVAETLYVCASRTKDCRKSILAGYGVATGN